MEEKGVLSGRRFRLALLLSPAVAGAAAEMGEVAGGLVAERESSGQREDQVRGSGFSWPGE
jgi:hypothetical protein